MTDAAKSALFEHCMLVYNKMLEDSTEERATEGFTGNVYRGHLTKLFMDLGLSVPYYTSVMGNLKKMNCVAQLRRGGGKSNSVWALISPPELTTFEELVDPRNAKATSGRQTVSQALQQQIRDLHAIVKKLEQDVELLKAIVIEGNQTNE